MHPSIVNSTPPHPVDMPAGDNAPMRRGGEERNDTVRLTEEFANWGVKVFSYDQLEFATNSFADDRIVGKGGFGIVYKGYVDIDTPVAVKTILPESCQGIKEYISEVKSLTQLRHRNLVRLVGCCHEKDRFALVYEFIERGSLHDHLFKNSPDRPLLTWERRHNIALGLASALHYLHKDCHQCVIHRDIKCGNVMLDENFEAKLGDFGLARLVNHADGAKTTKEMGTNGYMAPEYRIMGEASTKSDIYSFGVVLLEIVCGRRVLDRELVQPGLGLVGWVWESYGEWSWLGRGKASHHWRGNFLRNVVDKTLGKNFNERQAEAMLITGLWCAHPTASERPPIDKATAFLNLNERPGKLPTKMPRFNI